MLTAAGEALVVGARDAVVAILVVAALAAVTGATFLICRALRRKHAHTVLAAHVLGARIAVAAILGTATATEQRWGLAGRVRAAAGIGAAALGGCVAAREIRAAAAGSGLQHARHAERCD